jgi:hypothetical protein
MDNISTIATKIGITEGGWKCENFIHTQAQHLLERVRELGERDYEIVKWEKKIPRYIKELIEILEIVIQKDYTRASSLLEKKQFDEFLPYIPHKLAALSIEIEGLHWQPDYVWYCIRSIRFTLHKVITTGRKYFS